MDTQLLMDIARELLDRRELGEVDVVRGQFHDVVLVFGVAAVRVARRDPENLQRATELVQRLDELGFPFLLPAPLTDVVVVGDVAAVATAWVDGEAHPRGRGDPAELGRILDALADVPLAQIDDMLATPHAYAGGSDWYDLMTAEAIPRLPRRWHSEAQRRVAAAQDLPAALPSLVHGDLAGDNMRWDKSGRLVGILDWDLASPWDPAVDAACLSWHGWDVVRAAVGEAMLARARVWADTFGIEQIVAAMPDGQDAVAEAVDRAVAWLERTSRT